MRLIQELSTAYGRRVTDLDTQQAPTVSATGIGAALTSRHWIEDTTTTPPATTAGPGKPPYLVPLVATTRTRPGNGLRVVSTFAGGGGSCYGYQLAGYTVLWANEVVPAARDTYAANHPGTILDGRDVRQIQAADILAATGLARGELDLLDGSPPCQPFSTVGRREQGWGIKSAHGDGTHQIADDLFFEYIRLLDGLAPRAFVAENVSGLVKGTAKGYFKAILRGLRAAGYRVGARVLDARWLGVPQHRQRLFYVGLREDVAGTGSGPPWPAPLPYSYSTREALDAPVIGQIGNINFQPRWTTSDAPAATILTGRNRISGLIAVRHDDGQSGPVQRRHLTIAELRRICGFPDDYILTGTYDQQWARLGNAVPPPMTAAVAQALAPVLLAAREPVT